MYKIIFVSLILLLSSNTFAQQSSDLSNDLKLESVIANLNRKSPPLLILKLGKKEVLIGKEDLLEIGPRKIQRIEVFERAVRLKQHYAKNGAYVVYIKREFKKELKKKYLKTEPNMR